MMPTLMVLMNIKIVLMKLRVKEIMMSMHELNHSPLKYSSILLLSGSMLLLTPTRILSSSISEIYYQPTAQSSTLRLSDNDAGEIIELPLPECDNSVLAGEQAPDADKVACYRPMTTGYEIPRDLSYTERRVYGDRIILWINGFGDDLSEWQRAARYLDYSIHNKALNILVHTNEPTNREIFLYWINQLDDEESSQDHEVLALSAYGLYQLGDRSWLPLLEHIALSGVAIEYTSAKAVGLLARLGKFEGFIVIKELMASGLDVIQDEAVNNLIYFVPLHGQIDSEGERVDIWSLYRQALVSESRTIRYSAQLQLEEIGTPEALELLREFD
ncbi:MAG: hypothetical protein AAGG51_28430, partial [Cyanobacteria bacterium P01_G01_bin.54]